MREALVHLPTLDNNGRTLATVHAAARRALCEAFGGCTVEAGRGCWMHEGKLYDEEVQVYRVAMDATPANLLNFRAIGLELGVQARQVAVYMVHATGDVEIADVMTVEAAHA